MSKSHPKTKKPKKGRELYIGSPRVSSIQFNHIQPYIHIVTVTFTYLVGAPQVSVPVPTHPDFIFSIFRVLEFIYRSRTAQRDITTHTHTHIHITSPLLNTCACASYSLTFPYLMSLYKNILYNYLLFWQKHILLYFFICFFVFL